jgi:hypothetical protein
LDFWFFCMLLRDTPLPVLSWLSESEQMRFDAYNLAKNMCMISQVVQAPDLLREHQNCKLPVGLMKSDHTLIQD